MGIARINIELFNQPAPSVGGSHPGWGQSHIYRSRCNEVDGRLNDNRIERFKTWKRQCFPPGWYLAHMNPFTGVTYAET